MAVLEAFSTETPVMVRALDLYDTIIEPYAIEASDVQAMNQMLHELRDHPEMQQAYTEKSKAAAQEYSQARLARVWERFYREQAALV